MSDPTTSPSEEASVATSTAGQEDPRTLDAGEHVCLRSGCGRTHKRAVSGWAKHYCSLACAKLANGLAATAAAAKKAPTAAPEASNGTVTPLLSPAEARGLLGAQLDVWQAEGRQTFTAADLAELRSSVRRSRSWLHTELDRLAGEGRIQATGDGYRLLTPQPAKRRRGSRRAAAASGNASSSPPALTVATASTTPTPEQADGRSTPSEPEPDPAPAATDSGDDRRPCGTCEAPFHPARSGWKRKYCSTACMRAANPPGAKPKRARAAPAPATPAAPASPLGRAVAATASDRQVVAAPELPPAGQPPSDLAGYEAGHQDGFRSGVGEATELVWTLLRSPTFRDLDGHIARVIVREALV